MQHPVVVDDLLSLSHGDVIVASHCMIYLFFMQDTASSLSLVWKMHLSYHYNMNFVISPITIILLFFPFVNSLWICSLLHADLFLSYFFLEANMIKFCYLALVHNCIVFGTARLCSQNSCKGMGEVFNSPASMQMHTMFHILKM